MRNKQHRIPHGDDKERNWETAGEDYRFIKETIKKRPVNRKKLIMRLTAAASVCVLLSICAILVLLWVLPDIAVNAGGEEASKVTIPKDQPGMEQEADGEASGLVDSENLENYTQMSSELRKVIEKPQKAMVTVTGETGKESILDSSNLKTGRAYGVIFLEDDESYYILTDDLATDQAKSLQVLFQDGSTAKGILQESDRRTGLAVVCVPLKEVSKETREQVEVIVLGNSYHILQSQPVIALGSPAGYSDSVILGRVTSVSQKISVTDGEYEMIITDIPGSEKGSGILLNLDGEVIGILDQDSSSGEKTASLVKALAISPLKSLLEALANGEAVTYAGIYGQKIPESMKEELEVSGGVYVDRTEEDSPGMKAGIQSGDVIIEIGGVPVENMQEYAESIQQYREGQKVAFTLMRKGVDGTYGRINLNVTIRQI